METRKKFEVMGKVLEALEGEVKNAQTWSAYSLDDKEKALCELREEFTGDELEDAISRSYRIKNAQDEIDRYALEVKIYEHLKDYLYKNFQKIME